MKKEEGKVKAFVKEHGKEIVAVTITCGLLVCGGIMGWKMRDAALTGKYLMVKRGGEIANTLSSMKAVYPDKHCEYTGSLIGGFTPLDLGKLGEKMMNAGAPTNAVLTHFICVGPKVK